MRRSISGSTARDRKSTRLNSSHTEIYTLSLHDALPILLESGTVDVMHELGLDERMKRESMIDEALDIRFNGKRSEEHTSELQSHRDLHSFPTRRSSDLAGVRHGRRDARTRARRADEARVDD